MSTTNGNHDQPVACNRLLGRTASRRPNEVWVADITYVPTAEGWLVVAAVMDFHSRRSHFHRPFLGVGVGDPGRHPHAHITAAGGPFQGQY